MTKQRGTLRAAVKAFAALVAIVWLALLLACVRPSATQRAQSFVRQRQPERAVATLREHLVSAPDDRDARGLLARVLASAGDHAAARAEIAELARRSAAGDPRPSIELGHVLELAHQFDEALAAYDQAAQIARASPDGPRAGGLRAAHWGEAEEARPRLEEAVRRGARDAETYHALGLVRLRLGDSAGAEEAYRAGAAADPTDAASWLGLATVAVKNGDAVAALAAYDAVVARRPRYAAAQLGRAWAFHRLGRVADAARAIDHAEALGADVKKARAALATPTSPAR